MSAILKMLKTQKLTHIVDMQEWVLPVNEKRACIGMVLQVVSMTTDLAMWINTRITEWRSMLYQIWNKIIMTQKETSKQIVVDPQFYTWCLCSLPRNQFVLKQSFLWIHKQQKQDVATAVLWSIYKISSNASFGMREWAGMESLFPLSISIPFPHLV